MASVEAIAVPAEATSATVRVTFAMPAPGVNFQPAETTTPVVRRAESTKGAPPSPAGAS